MTLPRRLEPEWLDELPADDPRAVRSRRDLARVNVLMRQAGVMARTLAWHAPQQPRRLLDLGAGDGSFMLSVARRLAAHWSGVTVLLLDQQDIVSPQTRAGFAALGWKAETITGDVFTLLERTKSAEVDIVTSNLFLHHFEHETLRRLLERAAQLGWLFVACEPRRARFVVRMSRMLWAIGCNDVTVHDAVASARAGFDGRELSELWPSREGWRLHEHSAALFSHCFVAQRVMPQR